MCCVYCVSVSIHVHACVHVCVGFSEFVCVSMSVSMLVSVSMPVIVVFVGVLAFVGLRSTVLRTLTLFPDGVSPPGSEDEQAIGNEIQTLEELFNKLPDLKNAQSGE